MSRNIHEITAALADRYRIEREVGAGGMATVYLAHDLRHDRKVAVKVLRPELAVVLGAARFLSEIRTTATLQHPHILPLHDSGEVDGTVFYVMPYVTGETLRDRLRRERQLPVDDAIRIAREVADALGYAHAQGVIHRDIKPENILLQGNHALVADFGIALAASNTGSSRMTETGMSLGTPQYMSPEQAMGDRAIDARSDLYALGCVLYEMLTGEPPFTGPTAQSIVARIITEKPRLAAIARDTVPPHVDALLQRALAKLPADRPSNAQQFADALDASAAGFTAARFPVSTPQTDDVVPATPEVRRPRRISGSRSRLLPWIVAAAGLALGARGFLNPDAGVQPGPATQFSLELPSGVLLPPQGAAGGFNISPDGSTIVLIAIRDGVSRLYVRNLRDPHVRELAGTENAFAPFFSADGRSVAFYSNGWVRRIALEDGGVTPILRTTGFRGATWGPDGFITYGRSDGTGLWRVSASGGEQHRVTAPDASRSEAYHTAPSQLPGGTEFLFTIYQNSGETELGIVTRDGTVHHLGISGFSPRYMSSGHVLYNTATGDLMVVPFDARRREITGAPTLLLSGLRTAPGAGTMWSASPNGTIAAHLGSTQSRLVFVDRSGRVQILSDDARDFRLPRVSPDGNRIAIQATRGSENDIWIFDRRTDAFTRFTTGGTYSDPVWTPDGRRIAVASNDGSGFDIRIRNADGSGSLEPVLTAVGNQWPWSWTPDGRTLLFDETRPGLGTRIAAVTTGVDTIPRSVIETEYANRMGRLSPDGRWVAHVSEETGRSEVYVRPFPGPGGKQQISANGGDQPVWSRDGRQLFYRDGARMVAVSLEYGDEVTTTSRSTLFDDRYAMSNATNYDVMPDGSGFVMLESVDDSRHITVMVNWLDELRRRTAAR